MTMTAADFMFPRELQVSDSNIKNVLIIGSCAAGVWALKTYAKQVHFDYLVMNNVDVLPDLPPSPIEDYDFQFVQISLRHLVTDRVVKFDKYLSAEYRSSIIETAMQSIQLFLDACLKYNTEHGLLTFVSNFPVPQRSASAALGHIGTEFDLSSLVTRLNEHLANLVSKYTNVYIADYDALSNSMGKRYFHGDLMNFYSHAGFWHPDQRDYDVGAEHNAPIPGRIEELPHIDSMYPSQFAQMLEAVWRQWESMYRTVNQIDAVKLVIFDLDDTMWRGQIAEHYGDTGDRPVPHGWPTGLWEAIQHLRARGIMTAICSKNEESLVRARWDRAVIEHFISLDDFLFKEINWNPKAENVARIIKQASLTPKSVLFIDDNPVERESVRLALPGIRTLGANPYIIRRVLLWSAETQVAKLTEESASREIMMRRQIQRETERASLSREDFLRQLECSVKVRTFNTMDSELFPRSFELLNKTNQFNTTGERWSSARIAGFFDDGGHVFAFDVEDRFTKYGLVGVILYKKGCFQQFAMSCRVLGLEVETSVINAIVHSESERVTALSARVIETDANMVCRDIYLRCGFVADSQIGGLYLRQEGPISEIAPHLALTLDRGLLLEAAI